ncbi:MAG TPA: HAD family hydrolase [Candidatus Obscuribacterales bacterium]
MTTLNPDFASVSKEEAPKVVLFDLWRTLYLSLDKEPIKDLQEILEHNMQAGAHGHWEAELDPAFLRLCLTTNICDPAVFLNHVAGVFGKTVPAQALERFQAILAREVLNLARYEDVDETIEGLKEKGYRLGLISNLWAFPERRIFVDNGFGDNFEHRIYSFEVGHRKPEPEIFLEACKRFGVEPGDCLMVGDHPEADIKGSLRVGMSAALIDRPGEFRGHLPGVRVMRTLTELLALPSIKG